ncbi:MAG TPA: hypothetical protein VFW96_09460 [Thermomicrobiales bacterium]|nr:hypothetical protein [Thermomicrobiales bacterium]
MLRPRHRPGRLLAGLLAAVLLAGCGAAPTATPPPTATPLPPAAPTATAAPLGPLGPFGTATGSPGLPVRPGATIGARLPATGSPVLPAGPPTPTAYSAGAVAPAADGTCPADHPLKAVRLGQTYHRPDQASYARVRAEECFATAADAEAAGYRAAPR